jgi:DNA end-binding protein Ku
MAERPVWRGHLRLALVSCPVALHAAQHDSGNLHFHFINPATGHRVRMVTLDAETDQEVSRRDLERGYEFKKDHYLILTNADFEAARIDSSAVLNVEKFVPGDAIDPIYFDASYYVSPDGEAGDDVYVVLREAIARSGRIALSRVVIARRERAVAIMPLGRGLVAHTLHETKDLHDPSALFADLPQAKPDAEMVKLALQLVDRQTAQFDPADITDRYEARMREVIDAKLAGEGLAAEPDPDDERGNVIDLMAALKQSLGEQPAAAKKPVSARKSAPAKPAPPKKSTRRRA